MSAATVRPALPPVPSPAPRLHSDDELRAALAPFVSDFRARLAADRARHGPGAARMLAASRLAHYYTLMHGECCDGAGGWGGGAP